MRQAEVGQQWWRGRVLRPALAAITVLGLVLRLWRLGSVPPGLDADEASIGYNAYSILKTGRDEYGERLPLAFRAYGEYKRPVFIYAAVPAIAAFGPTPFAVRLPGAVAGTLAIPVLYVVARLLLRRRLLAFAAGGMLAISPWHLQFSRGAREASVLLLAVLCLAVCLLAALRAAGRGDLRGLKPPASGAKGAEAPWSDAPNGGCRSVSQSQVSSASGGTEPVGALGSTGPQARAPDGPRPVTAAAIATVGDGAGTDAPRPHTPPVPPWTVQPAGDPRERVPGLVTVASGFSPRPDTDRRTRQLSPALPLLGAALSFVLAVYTYPGGMVFAPLLVLVLLVAFRRDARRLPGRWGRWSAAAIALAVVLCLPLGKQLLDGRATARAGQESLFANPDVLDLAAAREERDRAAGWPTVLDAPAVIGARLMVDAYLSHFDPTYLFTDGDPEWRHHSSDVGQLYLWDLPLAVVGVLVLVRWRRLPAAQAIGGWLLVGPVPAAFAAHAPHAVRSIVMLPAWYLAEAAAIPLVWRWLRARGFQRDWLVLLGASLAFYLFMYYQHYPAEHARSWSSGEAEGYRAAQAEVAAGRFSRIVIAQQTGLNLVQALYATGYDPRAYLAQGGSLPDTGGAVRFAPFEYRDVDWRSEPRIPGTLYVLGAGTSLPPDGRLVVTIRNAGGYDAVLLATLGS